MKKKVVCVVAGVATIILLAGTTVSVMSNVKMIDKIDSLNSQIAKMEKKVNEVEKFVNPDKVQGDEFVTIGDQYLITDTKKISDAYKSGDESKLDDKEKETLKMAKEVIDKVVKNGMTNYEKELAIHDWMAENLSFDSSSLAAIPGSTEFCYKPYGVLKYKKSVCVGFATTFKMFMNMLDMDCKVVHDVDLSHSWDLVELEKDKWYYVDVTFDAGTTAAHTNFNLTESAFKDGHDFYSSDLPKAEDTTYSYAVMNAVEESDLKKIPKLVKKICDDKNKKEIYINVGNKSDKELEQCMLLFNSMQERISCINPEEMYANVTNSVDGSGNAIFGITIERFNNGESMDDGTLSEDLEKILDDLFGKPNYEGMGDTMGMEDMQNIENIQTIEDTIPVG